MKVYGLDSVGVFPSSLKVCGLPWWQLLGMSHAGMSPAFFQESAAQPTAWTPMMQQTQWSFPKKQGALGTDAKWGEIVYFKEVRTYAQIWGVDRLIESLSSVHEALSSISSSI